MSVPLLFPLMHDCCLFCVLLGLINKTYFSVFVRKKFYFVFCLCDLKLLAHKKYNLKDLFLFLPSSPAFCLDLWLMLVCADLLQKTKCLTQCLKKLSQLRWLALRPLVQMNHQTTSLALKGETSGLLCVVLPVISIPTSHLHSCVTPVYLIQS